MKHNWSNGLKKCPLMTIQWKQLLWTKIDNLLSVLNWDLKGATQTANTFDDLFSFELYTYINTYITGVINETCR